VLRVDGTDTNAPIDIFRDAAAVTVANRGQMHTALAGSARIFSLRSLAAYASYNLFETPNSLYRPVGHFAEILLVPESGLTDAIDDQIEGYLAWKWGLEGSLPAAHAYKSAAPTVIPPPPPAPPGSWVLGNGTWDDALLWIDTESWDDTP
jgi:hypothetical protein